MDQNSKALRAKLRSMAPVQAIPYIRQYQLPPEEELALIELDCRRKSVQQIAQEQCLSPETVKRRRKTALAKICSAQK